MYCLLLVISALKHLFEVKLDHFRWSNYSNSKYTVLSSFLRRKKINQLVTIFIITWGSLLYKMYLINPSNPETALWVYKSMLDCQPRKPHPKCLYQFNQPINLLSYELISESLVDWYVQITSQLFWWRKRSRFSLLKFSNFDNSAASLKWQLMYNDIVQRIEYKYEKRFDKKHCCQCLVCCPKEYSAVTF